MIKPVAIHLAKDFLNSFPTYRKNFLLCQVFIKFSFRLKIKTMDAKKIFRMIKPQLDLLDPSEKATLSKLISSPEPEKITCYHRRVRPISKAKEYLKKFSQKEMEREQNSGLRS